MTPVRMIRPRRGALTRYMLTTKAPKDTKSRQYDCGQRHLVIANTK